MFLVSLGGSAFALYGDAELHNSAVEYMKHGWRMDDLEEIRARIWVNIHALPRVSDVRRAYLNEKAAVELLKAAISEIT